MVVCRVAAHCLAQLPWRGEGFLSRAFEFLFARLERHRAFDAEGRRDLVNVPFAYLLEEVDCQGKLLLP